MSDKNKKSGLGQGLDGLMPKPKIGDGVEDNLNIPAATGIPLFVPIDQIKPNPLQPRKYFNSAEMETLTESIRQKGIIEPLVARLEEGGGYELIAGHRRLRAAKEAGLKEVPLFLKKIDDLGQDKLELALIENIVRADLNPIEEAEAYNNLSREFNRGELQIGKMVGKDRTTIINIIKLLDLTDDIKDDIRYGRMSASHGRAILTIKDRDKWPEARGLIISKSLSARQAEALARKFNNANKEPNPEKEADIAYYEALERAFTDSLGGLKVKINYAGKDKKIEITYHSNEEIENVMSKLGVTSV
jgi:ParB family chromosome partitioning protein